jgi:hypothetical protein
MIQKLLHNRVTKIAAAILPDVLFLTWLWISTMAIIYTLTDLMTTS